MATADEEVSPYKFGYAHDNLYGHVVGLLAGHALADGVHLDLGCGFGAIAEPIRERGLTYVGLDLQGSGQQDLRARGFETASIDLQDVPAAMDIIAGVLAGRPVASVTLLDTLEHLTSGAELLAALRGLAGPTGATLVVSLPNIAHRDIALKLLTGRFDYTVTGLLDHTHLVHHTEDLLDAFMTGAGWHEVDQDDLVLERSDQFFPTDHAMLAEVSTLHRFLAGLRKRAAPHADTNQFVRAYLPGVAREVPLVVDPHADADAPFLTVVIRTQGKRPETLRDAFLCLQGQTDQDFEVVVAVHRASPDEQAVVQGLVAELPASLRGRARVLVVEGGGRARPLNAAFVAARGRYVAVLDDDDLVLAQWVETFAGRAVHASGRVLRAVCVEQPIEPQPWADGRGGIRVLGPLDRRYPSAFDLFHHMERNHTPFMAYAFPRGLVRDLGMRFDESLQICEDWDFALRAALLVDVASTEEITCVYRRWAGGVSSASLHTEDEWRRTEQAIVAKIDAEPHVFPAGTMARIREDARKALQAVRAAEGLTPAAEGRAAAAEREILALLARNAELEEAVVVFESSRSWRVTRPMRAVVNRVKGGA